MIKEILVEYKIHDYYCNLLEDIISINEYNCIKLLNKHKLIKSIEIEIKDFPKLQREELAIYSIDNKCVFRKILKERKLINDNEQNRYEDRE